MVTNSLTALTELAVLTFSRTTAQPYSQYLIPLDDGVLNVLQGVGYSYHHIRDECMAAVPMVFPEPEFAPILAQEDDRTPMLMTVNGGSRITPDSVLSDLLASAWLQILLLGLRNDETTFVKLVVQNYEELKNAMKGEKVKGYDVTGISGVSLSEGVQVSTPWGTLRSAPKVEEQNLPYLPFRRPETTCTLVDEVELSVQIDLAAQPEPNFDADAEGRHPNANLLFALSCVMSVGDKPISGGPLVTWSTSFLPFSCPRGSSYPISPPGVPELGNFDEKVRAFETWAQVIAASHSEEMDFAASRLVSAIVHRADARDSLVDAVMVWENLLGARSEVSFRVSTALTKLLMPDADLAERRTFRKQLRKAYDTRSDIVHGATVDYEKTKEDRDLAVTVAVEALRELYRRGEEWITVNSTERTDALLLGS